MGRLRHTVAVVTEADGPSAAHRPIPENLTKRTEPWHMVTGTTRTVRGQRSRSGATPAGGGERIANEVTTMDSSANMSLGTTGNPRRSSALGGGTARRLSKLAAPGVQRS